MWMYLSKERLLLLKTQETIQTEIGILLAYKLTTYSRLQVRPIQQQKEFLKTFSQKS